MIGLINNARSWLVLSIVLGLVGGGYWWGHTATDNAWAARQAKADQKAAEALERANLRADTAAGNYLREHLEQEERYAELSATYSELRSRVPLVVPRTVPVVVATAPHGACTSQARVEADPSIDSSPRLTLAAVRMWNGSLTGQDQAAGTCGTAGTTEGAEAACSQGSGLTLDDAWANHAENAKSCAQDRQRFQHLIDYLNDNAQP